MDMLTTPPARTFAIAVSALAVVVGAAVGLVDGKNAMAVEASATTTQDTEPASPVDQFPDDGGAGSDSTIETADSDSDGGFSATTEPPPAGSETVSPTGATAPTIPGQADGSASSTVPTRGSSIQSSSTVAEPAGTPAGLEPAANAPECGARTAYDVPVFEGRDGGWIFLPTWELDIEEAPILVVLHREGERPRTVIPSWCGRAPTGTILVFPEGGGGIAGPGLGAKELDGCCGWNTDDGPLASNKADQSKFIAGAANAAIAARGGRKGPIVLVGEGTGGAMAMEVACAAGARVDVVAAVDPLLYAADPTRACPGPTLLVVSSAPLSSAAPGLPPNYIDAAAGFIAWARAAGCDAGSLPAEGQPYGDSLYRGSGCSMLAEGLQNDPVGWVLGQLRLAPGS